MEYFIGLIVGFVIGFFGCALFSSHRVAQADARVREWEATGRYLRQEIEKMRQDNG